MSTTATDIVATTVKTDTTEVDTVEVGTALTTTTTFLETMTIAPTAAFFPPSPPHGMFRFSASTAVLVENVWTELDVTQGMTWTTLQSKTVSISGTSVQYTLGTNYGTVISGIVRMSNVGVILEEQTIDFGVSINGAEPIAFSTTFPTYITPALSHAPNFGVFIILPVPTAATVSLFVRARNIGATAPSLEIAEGAYATVALGNVNPNQ